MNSTFGKIRVILLTYKDHLNKQMVIEEIRCFLGNRWDPKIAIAHETGDDLNPYNHTHILIDFGKSFQLSAKRWEFFSNLFEVHGNIKKCSGRSAWKDGLKYISKEDKDIGFEVERSFEDIIDEIFYCENEEQVLRLCTTSADVIPYLQIFKYKLLADRHLAYQDSFRDLELNEYQIEWWNRLQNQNDRQILWICDVVGGKGKTTFGKWLRVNHLAEKMKMKTSMVEFMYKGSEYVYINLTRTQEEYVNYGALEELKDGDIVCDKYEGRSVLFAPPKVIVFANFYPDVSTMTRDRWEIIDYDNLGADDLISATNIRNIAEIL